jgi:tetratricopeptide (TPR) repeat protein
MHEITIEKNTPFLTSKVWSLHADYYAGRGVEAWQEVPYYITSNPYLAHKYASIAAQFIIEGIANGSIDKEEPVYFLELGCGHGKLSFHTITALKEILKDLNLEDIKFCYVMTDLCQKNIDFWQDHVLLKEFVKEGILDYAIFDLTKPEDITLINQDRKLNKKDVKNPMIFFANYIFDSIPNDLLQFYNGEVSQGKITLTGTKDDGGAESLSNVNKYFDYSESFTGYGEEGLDELVEYYKKNIKHSKVLIPVATVHLLKYLRELTHDRLLILSTDKGSYTLEEISSRSSEPYIALHDGCCSITVNYHAINHYIKSTGGDALPVDYSLRRSTETVIFSYGIDFDKYPSTKLAYINYLERYNISDFNTIRHKAKDRLDAMVIDDIIALIRYSCFDSRTFINIFDRLYDIIHLASEIEHTILTDALLRIASNQYVMPASSNALFKIGMTLYKLKEYEKAYAIYDKSYKCFNTINSLYNMGLSAESMGDKPRAKAAFNEYLKHHPNDQDVKDKLHKYK